MKRILGIILLTATLVFTMVALTSCGKKPSEVNADTIRYDGTVVSWSSAENANKYRVEIDGKTFNTATTSITYTTANDSVTATITAIGKKDKESDSVSRTFTKLPEVTGINFDEDGVLSWDGVPGATAYLVEVNGEVSGQIQGLTYSDFKAGQNKIRVRATSTDNSTFSYWSSQVTKTYLGAPTGIVYDGDLVSWTGSSQATGYEVYINGTLHGTSDRASYEYDALAQSFNVSVKAKGNGNTVFNSKISEEERYVYLAQITEFTVTDGALTWEPVEDAAMYKVKIGNSQKVVTEPIFAEIPAGRNNVITVCPAGNEGDGVHYFSSWSAEQSVYLLKPPTPNWNQSLSHDGEIQNSFTWNPVTGDVGGYEVRLITPSGEETRTPLGKDIYFFGHSYTEVGEYSVSVKAVASLEHGGTYDSEFSTPVIIKRLAAPNAAASNFITSVKGRLAAGFTVTFAKNPEATSYKLWRDDVVQEGHSLRDDLAGGNASITVTDIVDNNTTQIQKIKYGIQAIGGVKTVAGQTIVTLSSLSSKLLEFEISVLPVPTSLTIDGAIMTWDSVYDASGYHITGCGDTSVGTPEYDLATITSAGTYDVKVCADGNGAEVLSSKFSAPLKVCKLPAPEGIRISVAGETEGTLMWNDVQNAKSYNAIISGVKEPVPAKSVTNINEYITESSVIINMVAVANYYSETNATYYLSSEPSEPKPFTKLATIVFNLNNYYTETSLIWNAPSNINASSYSPSYEVYNGRGEAYNGTINGTRMDLSYLDGGDYTFMVKAIGDGITYINSDMSEPVSLTKLDSPTISRTDDRTAFKWQGVSGAQRYIVRVDGKMVDDITHTGLGEYTYTPTVFDSIKTYVVTVTAVSDGAMDSNPGSITQVVKRLNVPDFSVAYSHTEYNQNGFVTVTIGADVPNATGYKYYLDGTATDRQTAKTYEFTGIGHGQFKFEVMATGGKFDSSDIYYIDSAVSTAKTFTVLGTVASGSIKVTQEGKISWTPVPNANGYKLVIVYEDGEVEVEVGENATYQIDNYTNKRPLRYKIKTVGNGTTEADSEYLEWSNN